jgi:hypothetical protein
MEGCVEPQHSKVNQPACWKTIPAMFIMPAAF